MQRCNHVAKYSMSDLSPLESAIGLKFKNQETLQNALVHRSFINENHQTKEHNERLEFLGDAVLELIVTDHLYNNYPNPEGDLTNWRAALVNSHMLASCATEISLEKYLLLSKGEAKDDNSKARQYILANAYEALIGAIYLDQGYAATDKFIKEKLLTKLDYILDNELYIDSKSKFQEEAQAKTGVTPRYEVLEESGPDHNKHFKIGIYLNKEIIATGTGTSKQEAQMDAAKNALTEKGW
jgi:ribonuclease III